jgi:hypothetical protein
MQNGLLDFVGGRSFGRPDLSLVAGAQGARKIRPKHSNIPKKKLSVFFYCSVYN